MRNARLLYVFGGPDTLISLRSLKLEDTVATRSGRSTIFTPYVGIKNSTSNDSGFINTNIWASSSNGITTASNALIGVLIRNNTAENAYDIGAYKAPPDSAYFTLVSRNTSNMFSAYMNNFYTYSIGINLPDSTSKGFFFVNRPNSDDTIYMYKNGIKLLQSKKLSRALPAYFITIGTIRYAGTGASPFSTRQYAAMWYGAGLTYTQQYNLNEHLKWFYWRVGQPITATPLPDASPVFASDTTGGLTKDNNILFTYTPIMKENDTLKMYYWAFGSYDTSAVRYYRMISTNFGTSWINQSIVTITGLARDAIIRDPSNAGNYRMLYHKRQGDPVHNDLKGYKIIPATSTNQGLTFTGTSDDTLYKVSNTALEKVVGEDVSMMYDTDSSKYNIYFRPFTSGITDGTGNGFRKIALSKTTNFDTYTYYNTILPVDTNNFSKSTSKDYRKSFYSMTVFKTAPNEWWGLANVMTHHDWPNNDADTGVVDVELVFSRNGIQWHRTNDTNVFIPRFTNVKQLFAYGTVVNDQIQIYGFYDIQYHGDHTARGANKWVIRRYKITIADLRKYIPRGI